MKLTVEQQIKLEEIAEKDARYREAHTREHAIARRQADERILALRIERDKAAAEAFLMKIPKAQIHKVGLGTTNARAANEAIEHGLPLLPRVEEAPAEAQSAPTNLPSGIEGIVGAEGGTISVQLADSEFDAIRESLPVDPASDRELRRAEFTVQDGRVLPVSDDYDNPTVRLVMGASDKYRKAILEAVSA